MHSVSLAIVVTRDFFDAFAKLRKASVSFLVSVRRPFVWNNSAPAGRSFVKMYMGEFYFEVDQAKPSLATIERK